MKRYGMVIGLKPEAETKYREYHAAVWPGVLAKIQRMQYSQLFHLFA